MELASVTHIEPGQITDFEADVFITTLGLESRCTTNAKRFEKMPFRKIALAITDQAGVCAFEENQAYYQLQGYEIIQVQETAPEVGSILESFTGEKINLLLDCTNMPLVWYYEIFRWFIENPFGYTDARIRIVYTMGRFPEQEPVLKFKSVTGLVNTGSQHIDGKKSVLIMGLGHEKKVCVSIYDFFRPDMLYLFYADPPVDKQFVDQLLVHNHSLIEMTPIRNLIAYPIRNAEAIFQRLVDTVLPLRDACTITVIPNGPKLFSVAVILLHLRFPDIGISYATFKKPPFADRHPAGEPVALDVRLEGEE